mgnify:CR=1 FL=1
MIKITWVLKSIPMLLIFGLNADGITACLIEQPEKAFFPIEVTDDGIVIFDKDMHFSNAYFFIVVTEDGNETFFKDLQFPKHLFGILSI